MASIVLGVVGSYFGPIGGAVGAALGSYIDQAFLFPALFPKSTIEGPRIDGAQIQSAQEGTPSKWVIGKCRIAGTVRWLGEQVEHVSTKKVGKGDNGQKVKSYSYTRDIAVKICSTKDLPGRKIKRVLKIWANSKLIYDGQPNTKYYSSLTFYDGSQTTADPTIVAKEGAGNVPSFKNSAYVVIKDVVESQFSSTMPNFQFLVEQDPDLSLGEAITLVMGTSTLTPDDFDVTRVPQCFKGLVRAGPQEINKVLGVLLMGYGLAAQESGTKVVFFSRGEETVINVDSGLLAAVENDGDSAPKLIEISDLNEFQVPTEVNVKFISTDNDFQPGGVRERRIFHTSNNNITIDLPLTLKRQEAGGIGKRFLWQGAVERQKIKLNLPPSLIEVQEGDVVSTTIDSVDYSVYCTQVTRGANFQIEVEGVVYHQPIFTQEASVQNSGATNQTTIEPTDTQVVVFDAPAMLDALTETIGVYFGICADSKSDAWPGARLYTSPDGVTYSEGASAPAESTLGTVIIPPHSSPPWIWDEDGYIDIEFNNGTMISCTEQELLSGKNRLAVLHPTGEWEIIGAQHATIIDSSTIRVSRLLRGLRGTEHLINGHVSGARVVVLEQETLNFFSRPSSLGSNDYYKGPMIGGLVSEYPASRAKILGITRRPFSPVLISGEFDSSTDDLVFSWMRRSKKFFSADSLGQLASDEFPEKYEIEFRNGGELAPVLRVVTVIGTTSGVYTSDDQAADGLTPGASLVRVSIYQISSAVGRGYPGHKVFIP